MCCASTVYLTPDEHASAACGASILSGFQTPSTRQVPQQTVDVEEQQQQLNPGPDLDSNALVWALKK